MPIKIHSTQSGIQKALRFMITKATVPGRSTPPCQERAALSALARLLPRAHRGSTSVAPAATSPENALSIPVPEISLEEQANETAFSQGQFLARQDQWLQLFEQIDQADRSRQITPSGTPIAEVLAFGARSDVLNAVEHALSAGLRLNDPVTVDGIMALERMRLELNRCPLATAYVAQAHLDIAWTCQRQTSAAHKAAGTQRAHTHLNRAQTLLAPLNARAEDSSFIAAAHCALYTGLPDTPRAMADRYSALMAMIPRSPRPMRALGGHMLRHGGPQVLELEARRTAALLEDHWGAGGYTWVYFDALPHSDIACETVDVQFFLDGFADIVEQAPHQEMVNLLAAYCGLALHLRPNSDRSLSGKAQQVRREISDSANWLIRNHLCELHPMIWAHAAEGFDNDAQVRSARRFAQRGRTKALRVIADQFKEEIASGNRVVFTEKGPDLVRG